MLRTTQKIRTPPHPRASEEGILKGQCPLSRRRHVSPIPLHRRTSPQQKEHFAARRIMGTPKNPRTIAPHGRAPQRAAKRQTVRHRRSDAPGAISPPEIGSGGAHRTKTPSPARHLIHIRSAALLPLTHAAHPQNHLIQTPKRTASGRFS